MIEKSFSMARQKGSMTFLNGQVRRRQLGGGEGGGVVHLPSTAAVAGEVTLGQRAKRAVARSGRAHRP